MLNIRSKRIINTVIANVVKQSSLVLRPPGLLHYVRNDENFASLAYISLKKWLFKFCGDYLGG